MSLALISFTCRHITVWCSDLLCL